MTQIPTTKISKFLSRVLRHKPKEIGLTLDTQGWADVTELLSKLPMPVTREVLQIVVDTNEKQRFILSPDGSKIRANQGHSIKIDLGLEAIEPPETLYHGTATRFLNAIRETGLKPMSRQHVHLSATIATATKVGKRHGIPHILHIPARTLAATGQPFYQSENGVWLTGPIAPEWIKKNP